MSARITSPAHGSARAMLLASQDALGTPEHDRDEETEREHVAPLDVKEDPADRDELREDECGDQAADEVAEAAEHADQERDRAEREADRGMDVVLQDEQARS